MSIFEFILYFIGWWHVGFFAFAWGSEFEIEDKVTRHLGYCLAFFGPVAWLSAFYVRQEMKDFDET